MLLAYDDHGPGPVVVLLHGFPLNRKIWSLQEGRVGSMYRIIAPDLRGHGETAAPPGIYSMEAMAEDVIELLDALQISEPIVLGGLSMGGYVALALIAKYPERVRGLMLIDTRASADTPEVARNREDLARKTEASGKVGHVVEGMFPRMFSDATRVGHPERLTWVRAAMEKTSARAVVGALRGMASRPDRTADLALINVPTLVMVGAEDVITPPDESRKIKEALPHAELVIIPKAGHIAPFENPDAANEAILRFLASLH